MNRIKTVPLQVWIILMGAAYVAFGLVARFSAHHEVDAAWFVYVADRILDGSFDIYSRFDQVWAAPPLGMAFTYPPLMPLILAPFVWLGRNAGLSAQGIQVLIGLPWLVCDVLLAAEIASLTAEWTSTREGRWRLIAFLLCLMTFVVPVSSGYMGHHESLVLLLILLAIRAHTALLAGIWWGLALASKQTAIFALLPVLFLALRDVWRWRRSGLLRLAALSVPVVALPLALIAPFWLRWPVQVSYSLFGAESHRILYGINVPYLANALASRLFPVVQPALGEVLVRWTSPIFLLLSTAFALLFALRRTEFELGSDPRRPAWRAPGVRVPMIATMGAAYAAFLVLGKWSDMHYRFMPLMFLLVLDLLEHPNFPYVYVLFAFGASSYAFAEALSGYWRLVVFGLMAGYFAIRSWQRVGQEESVRVPPLAPRAADR